MDTDRGGRRARGRLSGLTCEAFPAGIPDAIIMNMVDHRELYLGDGGQRFLPVSPAALDYARRMFDGTL